MADETAPGDSRTSKGFDEIQTRALKGWASEWDGGFNNIERVNFVANHRRMVAHVDRNDVERKAVSDALLESRTTRRFRAATRWTAIGVLVAGLQTGLILITRQSAAPPTIVVKLPGGQNVTVTPPSAASPTVGGTQP